MKCLNIVIFYDNREEVERYIKEVASISQQMVDMLIVVNKDTYGDANSLKSESDIADRITIIDYDENVGYLNAMLKPIKQINIDQYDYVILSNTDIHYEQKDFFQKLLSNYYSADIGCIAPSVFSTGSHNYQNPHYKERVPKRKIERLIRLFEQPLLGRCYLSLSRAKHTAKKTIREKACYVYSPNGSYMIFTKEFIKRIKGYEYGVILYSEESCIGELLLKYNMKCYYDDSIEVIHQESTVTGKMDYKKRFGMWKQSLQYILEEFY